MHTRLRHLWLALTALPGLLTSRRRRALLREMRAFARRLPAGMDAPLPQAMDDLAPAGAPTNLPERDVRRLADLVALLDRRSPLGLCLRRSLLRYHFLRREGVPLVVHFGAKFVDDAPQRRLTGHAWVTKDGRPYHEADENWRDFTVMFTWPQEPDAAA